jgi:hypothetical protein
VPEKLTLRGWLNQPFASAARDEAAVTAGAVASYLRAKELEALWFPALSEQEPLTEPEAVSGPE